MFAENPADFLADFGISATWYGIPWIVDRDAVSLDTSKIVGSGAAPTQTALVIFDQPDADTLGGRAQSRNYRITFPVGQFVGVKYQDAFLINGVQYAVKVVESLSDGAWVAAELEAIGASFT